MHWQNCRNCTNNSLRWQKSEFCFKTMWRLAYIASPITARPTQIMIICSMKKPCLKRLSEFHSCSPFYDDLMDEKKTHFKRFLRILSFLARWPRIDNSWTWGSEKMSSGRFSVVLEISFFLSIYCRTEIQILLFHHLS